MTFDHNYYKGAAEAHVEEVKALHEAAARIGRCEQWLAAVDYMKKLEDRIKSLEDSNKCLVAILSDYPKGQDDVSWIKRKDEALNAYLP